jgi:glutamine cyclotransferase
MRGIRLIVCWCLISFAVAASSAETDTFKVIHTYPHDPNAFTQGLCFSDGQLYESDGLYGQSSLREDDLATGQALQKVKVPGQYFAEGLTNWGNTLIQLTWKAHVAFVYDRTTFRLLRTLHYEGEGWGLTQDGKSLIMSDGTSTLRYLNPETFAVERTIHVTDHGKPTDQLNELEYVHGEIYANIWQTDRIARISPRTGDVIAWIDMRGILPDVERRDSNAVLNGIAYDPATHKLYVTGKLWPKLFEIEVVREK